jgi:hypothetical protein
MWDTKHKILAGVAIVTFGLAGFLFYSWLQAHDAQQKAEATSVAQKESFATAAQTIKDLRQADADRAAQTSGRVQIIREQAAQQVTPEQIAAAVAKAIGSQTPIKTETVQATLENPKPGENLSITPQQQALLKDYTTECEVCKVQRTALQADVASRDSQLKAAGEQLSAVSIERDAWKKAAKGTFWSRTKSGLKYVTIGGGVIALALGVTGHLK